MKPSQPIELPDIYRGCTWPPIVLEWKDVDGQPFDLTGWLPFAFATRFNLNAIVTNAVAGLTRISMNFNQTFALKLGVDHWDWIWTGEGLTYPPVLTGTVLIKDRKSAVV